METYQQSVELFIHSFQAQLLFAGCMLKYSKIPPNTLTTIKENKAKVLLRWLLLEVVAFAMIIRIPYIIFMNPANEKLNSSEKINMYLTIFTFLCFITTAERYRNLGCSPEKVSSFVNALFVMKTKYFGDAKIKCPSFIKVTIHCSRLICFAVTGPIQVFIVMACIYDPTLAINVFWFLPIQMDTPCKFIQLIITAILNFIVWHVAGLAGYGLLAEVLMGIIPMQFSQKLIIRRLTKVFQGYETMYKVKNEIFVYRAFNIVVELFNECVSSVMVLFLVTVGGVQIIPTALLIKQTNSDLQIPWALNIFLIGMVAEASFILLCVFSFPGDFYENSKKSLDFLQRRASSRVTSGRNRKHAITILRSCSVPKIRLGLSNFIEKTTPPVYQLFCTDRIIDILLTQNSS